MGKGIFLKAAPEAPKPHTMNRKRPKDEPQKKRAETVPDTPKQPEPDPFALFDEWAGEEDSRAYATL